MGPGFRQDDIGGATASSITLLTPIHHARNSWSRPPSNSAIERRGNRSALLRAFRAIDPSRGKRGLSMQLYLPIADLPVNVFLVLAMGAAVGFVSGMFGIGGGFLMTPLLIFIGIPPAVAVASVASHIAASSFSGALAYWRRRAIDPALASVLLCGGVTRAALRGWALTPPRAPRPPHLVVAP